MWLLPARAAPASLGCSPPARHFGVPSDPLSSRAGARASLSPHWSRRSRRARGRGRARARAEREAAAALGRRARPDREPPRARRGHARDPPQPRLCPRGALLTPEGAGARPVPGARGGAERRGAARAAAPLALLPPGQRGELELKARPLLLRLPVPARHAVAMARTGEGGSQEPTRLVGRCSLPPLRARDAADVVPWCTVAGQGLGQPEATHLTHQHQDDSVGVSTADTC